MVIVLIWYFDTSFEENLIDEIHEKSDEEESCPICLEIFHEK